MRISNLQQLKVGPGVQGIVIFSWLTRKTCRDVEDKVGQVNHENYYPPTTKGGTRSLRNSETPTSLFIC